MLVGVPAGFFAIMAFVDGRTLVDERWWYRQAELVTSESTTPPGPEAAWQRVPMTDLHTGQEPDRSSLWWRFELPLEARQAGAEWLFVVPFPRLLYLELWLDGEKYDVRGDPEFPLLKNPVWFSVVNPEQGAPSTRAYLRVVTGTPAVSSSPVLIGPKGELTSYLRYIDSIQRFMPQATMAMMAMMAAIMASVYFLRRRRDPVFGWYALMLAAWTLHLTHSQNESPPFGDPLLWIGLSYMTLGWFTFASTLFVHSLLNEPVKRIAIALGIWAVIGFCLPSLLRGMDPWPTLFLSFLWVPSLIFLTVYVMIKLVRACWRQPNAERLGFLVLTFFLFVVGIRDFLYNNLAVVPGNVIYLRFAAGLALIVFSVLLIRRFVQAFDTAEMLNITLEERVQEKARQLDEQYRRNAEMERREVLLRERERLLRDMHDGLGGHLVHPLALAEQEPGLQPMAPQLKLALEDLRLIIDSLDPADSAFDAVFSFLRARFARTAESLGLALQWNVDPALDEAPLNPHEVLTLARIVQEAVTNVIKHAQAEALRVSGAWNEARRSVSFSVTDDGVGLPAELPNGRGLTSMRTRIAELGGTLEVFCRQPGTELCVTFSPREGQ